MTPPELSAFVYGVITGSTMVDPETALSVLKWILRNSRFSEQYRDGKIHSIGIEGVLSLGELTIEKRK